MSVRSAIALQMVVVQIIVAAAMLAVPRLTHRDILFGIPVLPDFRASEIGRKALRQYRMWITIPACLSLVGTVVLPNSILNVITLIAVALIGLIAFVVMNHRLKPYAVQPRMVYETAIAAQEQSPWFLWLGLIPLAFLAWVVFYMHSHWNQIPLRYPVHFDIDGTPNRWTDRSFRGVYGVLIFGGEMALFLYGMAVAGWYGSRRSDAMRRPMVLLMLSVEATITLAFGQIPLQATRLVHIPIAWIIFCPFVLLIPAIWYAVHESNQPREPLDPTPNECWKGGMIYYNPNDAALFVQRRDSLGFTVNMGNRWSWFLYGSLLLVIASGPFVIRLLPN